MDVPETDEPLALGDEGYDRKGFGFGNHVTPFEY